MGIEFDFNAWTLLGIAAVCTAGFVLWRVFGKRGGGF